MQSRIHQLLDGISDIVGGERSAVREKNAAAQVKRNLASIL